MVDLSRTIKASLKSGSTPLLGRKLATFSPQFAVAVPLCVDPHQLQLLPAALYDVLDPQVKLAAHDNSIRFSGELVQEIKRNGVYLIVDVKTRSSLVSDRYWWIY